jgi:ferric enterobactin receptor
MRRITVITLMTAVAVLVGPRGAEAQGRPGQQPPAAGPGEVRGTVVDAESRQPVASVSVEVWSAATNALVAGAIGRPDGMFRVEGLQPGTYALRIAMIGYEPHRMAELTIEAASPRVNVGSIALSRSPIVLDGVEVRAESPVVVAPDRNIYRAREIAPAAANAADVLENVPSVQVDPDGKLSLRGNENVVVQINGRPAPLSGMQLAAYLRQLPAGTIERVEVIPNPSARQDPEGMAGIVNIVMKQTVDLGRSGGGTLTGSTSGRYGASGNFGYQGGAVTLFTTYGFFTDDRNIAGINDRTRLGPARAPLSFTEQDIDGKQKNEGHNITTNLDYRLNRRDVLYTTTQLNWRTGADGSLSEYSELDAGRVLLDRYDRTRDTGNRNRMADIAAGFRRTVAPQRHELTAELRMNQQSDRDETALWRLPAGSHEGAGALEAARIDGEANEVDATTRQFTAQLDYTRPLGAKTKLETGYKGNWRWMDRDYTVRYDQHGTGDWVRGDYSNALELDESVNAVYGVVSGSLGRLDLQAGLRAEHASREFAIRDGERFPHDYTSLFPSGVISYKLNDLTQARLSYSRRIRRPGTQELNPFPSFFDAQNVFFGNPQLGPEYTDAVEMSLQRSGKLGSVQISPFYRYTRDIIRVDINTADTLGGREITSISFRNLDTSKSWGADLNGQLRAGKLSGIAGLNVFKMVTDGGGTSNLTSDAVAWMGRLNGSYAATPQTTLQAMYFYRAPMNFERGRFSSTSALGFAVRQKLPRDNLFMTVRASDVFNTNRFTAEVGDDNIVQLTGRSFSSRALHLSLQYSVGQAPRVRQRQEQEPQGQTGFPPM